MTCIPFPAYNVDKGLTPLNNIFCSILHRDLEFTQILGQSHDKDNKTKIFISEPKTFSSLRTIPFPQFLLPIIREFQDAPESYILSGSERVIVEPRTMQNHFKRYLELGGINDANFHSLRHTFATRCIESNFDIKSLSEILGHSSVKTTLDKYVHSTMKQKKINMEKIKMVI